MQSVATYKKPGGFTFVEMSIVLTIIALIAGAGLTLAARHSTVERTRVTEERLAFIMTSLQRYWDEKGYMPCPADGSLDWRANNFGIGVGTNTATPNNCSAANFDSSGVDNVVMGVVPVYSLNIDPVYMLDGWSRKFTYVVDQDFTDDDPTLPASPPPPAAPASGKILVQDASGDSLMPNAAAGEGAVVLVLSHGENGHGAWHAKGGSRIDVTASGNHERDNADDTPLDNIYRLVPYRTQTVGPDEIFDDIMDYRTRWQLDN